MHSVLLSSKGYQWYDGDREYGEPALIVSTCQIFAALTPWELMRKSRRIRPQVVLQVYARSPTLRLTQQLDFYRTSAEGIEKILPKCPFVRTLSINKFESTAPIQPTFLAPLPFLKELNLSSCARLDRALTTAIGNARGLTRLSLVIPPSRAPDWSALTELLGSLTRLEEFVLTSLDSFDVKTIFEEAQLPELKRLRLELQNTPFQVSVQALETICDKFPRLESFHLEGFNLVPDTNFGQLSVMARTLRELAIVASPIDTLSWLSEMRVLESLDLTSSRNLSGSTLTAIASCPTLKTLVLVSVPALDDAVVATLLSCLPELRTLHIGGGFFDARIVWTESRLTAKCLDAIDKATKLESLYLFQIAELRDESLLHLRKLPVLRDLQIVSCKAITDVGIASLALIPTITRLSLDECSSANAFYSVDHIQKLRREVEARAKML